MDNYRINISLDKWKLSATIALINLLHFLLSTDGVLIADYLATFLLALCAYFVEIKIKLFKE
jgi:hypothetical protein